MKGVEGKKIGGETEANAKREGEERIFKKRRNGMKEKVREGESREKKE